MARKRQPDERKLRTRAHVLADLSINHMERQILLRGFALNRLDTDYGIDLLMLTYNEQGEVETGHVLFQVKVTVRIPVANRLNRRAVEKLRQIRNRHVAFMQGAQHHDR